MCPLTVLQEDLKLLCQNAMTFNEEGHWVHEEAKKLLEQGTAVLESYRGRVDPAGLKPDAKKQRREQLARERAEKEVRSTTRSLLLVVVCDGLSGCGSRGARGGASRGAEHEAVAAGTHYAAAQAPATAR